MARYSWLGIPGAGSACGHHRRVTRIDSAEGEAEGEAEADLATDCTVDRDDDQPLTDAQIRAAQDCVLDLMLDAYADSGDPNAEAYGDWTEYSTQAYPSATHGGRYVRNLANETAEAYGLFEEADTMPVGSVLAKDSFSIDDDGTVAIGPLFLMEKMEEGFHAESGDWRYATVSPGGYVDRMDPASITGAMQSCISCHAVAAETDDHMLFLPEEYRR